MLPGGSLRDQVDLAVLAEEAGWDGVFTWEGVGGHDPWGLLSAMAVRTSRVRLGTMITPLPWRRPWTVASQAATLDQLSQGRAVIAVGLGAMTEIPPNAGEAADRRERAALLDEGIEIITALHSGSIHTGPSLPGPRWPGVSFFEPFTSAARPVQTPRVAIWVVGAWPRPRSMERVLRCDGVVVEWLEPGGERGGPTPEGVAGVVGWLAERGRAGTDVVVEGETPADDPAAAADRVRPLADAGATWWLETRWAEGPVDEQRMTAVRERLAAGPPRV